MISNSNQSLQTLHKIDFFGGGEKFQSEMRPRCSWEKKTTKYKIAERQKRPRSWKQKSTCSHIFLGSQSGPPCSTQSSKLKAWTSALVEWNRTWVNAGMSNKKADPFTNLVVSPSLARTLLVRTSSPYLQPIEISFGGAKRVKATCGISLARLLEDIFCG